MQPIAYRHSAEILDFSQFLPVPVDYASIVPWASYALLVSSVDATANSGRYAIFLNSAGSVVYAISDGTTWRPTGAVVAGGIAYPTFESVVAAGLATGTSIYWVPTGQMYISDNGHPVISEFYVLGLLTKIAEVVGNEPDAASALNITEDKDGGGDIIWDPVAGYVRMTSTATPSDNCALRAANGLATGNVLMSGLYRLPAIDTDANAGHRIANIAIRNGSFATNMIMASDLGAMLNDGNSPEPETIVSAGGLVEGNENFQWVDAFLSGNTLALYVDHALRAVGSVSLLGTANTGETVFISDSWSSGGEGELQAKNIRVYTGGP